MRGDGAINLDLIPRLCAHYLREKVSAVFVCGTTGEGLSLTGEERLQIVDKWIETARDKLPVIVNVSHLSIAASQALARHAQSAGAFAIASCGPTFCASVSSSQMVVAMAQVAEAAPKLPFYFYYIPQLTHYSLQMVNFVTAAARVIPRFQGVKFTHSDLAEFMQLMQLDSGRFEVMSGRDQLLLGFLACGATTAVGSTFNFAAGIAHAVHEAFERGDLMAARDAQIQLIRIMEIMRGFGGLCAMKATMKFIGLDCGPTRPPLDNLDDDQLASLQRSLRSCGRIALRDHL
jgi:N-acetylneuraminate lyase